MIILNYQRVDCLHIWIEFSQKNEFLDGFMKGWLASLAHDWTDAIIITLCTISSRFTYSGSTARRGWN